MLTRVPIILIAYKIYSSLVIEIVFLEYILTTTPNMHAKYQVQYIMFNLF